MPTTPTVTVLSGLSRSGRSRVTRSAVRFSSVPSRTTVITSGPAPCARIARDAVSQSSIRFGPTAKIRSPCCRPAAFAGEGGSAAVHPGAVAFAAGMQSWTESIVVFVEYRPIPMKATMKSRKPMTMWRKTPA